MMNITDVFELSRCVCVLQHTATHCNTIPPTATRCVYLHTHNTSRWRHARLEQIAQRGGGGGGKTDGEEAGPHAAEEEKKERGGGGGTMKLLVTERPPPYFL